MYCGTCLRLQRLVVVNRRFLSHNFFVFVSRSSISFFSSEMFSRFCLIANWRSSANFRLCSNWMHVACCARWTDFKFLCFSCFSQNLKSNIREMNFFFFCENAFRSGMAKTHSLLAIANWIARPWVFGSMTKLCHSTDKKRSVESNRWRSQRVWRKTRASKSHR